MGIHVFGHYSFKGCGVFQVENAIKVGAQAGVTTLGWKNRLKMQRKPADVLQHLEENIRKLRKVTNG